LKIDRSERKVIEDMDQRFEEMADEHIDVKGQDLDGKK
jgi:hypothetical protein